MPTELEELVEFLHHGNTQIRQIACENLVGYSSNATIFKNPQFIPIKDLKLLVRDYPPIAKNALTILINLTSHDQDILKNLAEDDDFLTILLQKVTHEKDTTAHLTSQLLANLSKSPSLSRLLTLTLPIPPSSTTPRSPLAINQLLDLFVTSAAAPPTPTPPTDPHTTPSDAHFDYISYLLADLSATHTAIRNYFLAPQGYDGLIPLTKITIFTSHASLIRRSGVARVLKNVSFETSFHRLILSSSSPSTDNAINILPYLLLPLCGPDTSLDPQSSSSSSSTTNTPKATFTPTETDSLLPDLQFLPSTHILEPSSEIIITHIETLMLLSTTRHGREELRNAGVYPVVRVLHENVDDDGVREVCERLVNLLMRDEEDDDGEDGGGGGGGGGESGSVDMDKDLEREVEEVF